MAFHPYLFFGSTCRAAFTRYQEIFGGELQIVTTADMPEGERMEGAPADAVMHAALMVGDALLMGSDDPTSDGGPVKGMVVSYSATDVDDAKRVFEALAEGGEVNLPVSETSWSPAFGMCIDRFGTPWMVGANAPDQG
jgi:PhnB protein